MFCGIISLKCHMWWMGHCGRDINKVFRWSHMLGGVVQLPECQVDLDRPETSERNELSVDGKITERVVKGSGALQKDLSTVIIHGFRDVVESLRFRNHLSR